MDRWQLAIHFSVGQSSFYKTLVASDRHITRVAGKGGAYPNHFSSVGDLKREKYENI
jgi:hypothetical protein